jgi:hypothetical protein
MLDGSALPVGYSQLKSKEPVFENGNYRLNFNGRVTMASVKVNTVDLYSTSLR